jgi:hypothetical protein
MLEHTTSATELFVYVNKRHPQMDNQNEMRELTQYGAMIKSTPPCFRHKPETVLGWDHHMEHRSSPWEDDKRIWYADGTYVDKAYLSKSKHTDEWLLQRIYARALFYDFNDELKSKNK